MYTQDIQYKIIAEVRGNLPFIKIGVRFNDYFTQDTYALVSEIKNKYNGIKSLPFLFYKNNKLVKEFIMDNYNIQKVLDDMCNEIEDYDFKKYFSIKAKNEIIKEVKDYSEFYHKTILLNEVTLEGELLRMKKMAGIIS